MTPLEAMARAICRRLNEQPHQWSREAPSLEAFVEVAWPSYVSAARAGLAAIQPPPATLPEVDGEPYLSPRYMSQTVLRTMIDAILKDAG